MKTTSPRISVIIVNYNVKEYLEQALHSLKRALANIPHEIFVVDNASVDGSVPYIRHRFPEVILIENSRNLGFGRANNQALRRARGEFVVIINPDTVVQEDTFRELLAFFESHPDAGAATCKILNPDGSFSVDCRHSIPTPMIAFWKVIGFSKLFPRSRLFGRYNLTYLDPDQTYPVPAISGSFMMIRKSVLDEVGYFDERFFMYCEDIDLCHRINQAGAKIYYVPTTQIIHYKGESTRKHNLDYVITFNKALYQFFQKHYAGKSIFLLRWLIVLGIVVRGVLIYLRNFMHERFPLLLDTLLLNLTLLISFVVRYELKSGFTWYDFFHQYGGVNLIASVIFLAVGYYLDVYPHHRLSIQAIVKTNIITFILLASLTFFLKQFAFSRMVVLASMVVSPLLMIAWRAVMRRFYRGDKSAWGKDLFTKPTILVGRGEKAVELYRRIRNLHDLSYELLGVVTVEEDDPLLEKNGVPVLGSMDRLTEVIRIHRVRQVIFSSEMLSYERILKTMAAIDMPQLEYKIVASNAEVVIGKSSIERLDTYPLMEVEYAVGRPFNRITKRLMDMGLSLPLLLVMAPVMLPGLLWMRRRIQSVRIVGRRGQPLDVRQVEGLSPKAWVNRFLILWEIVRGRLSLVGAPIERYREGAPGYGYKPGLTGLVQINRRRISSPEELEKYHLFYLKNQSVMLDLEILFKTVVG
ncbi:MAG: glycosyltransferase [Calditrichaeota bacterium]|nr:MAG: glycosyltransferase [Calditrichota bacterium]